jgi:hypothetical protein
MIAMAMSVACPQGCNAVDLLCAVKSLQMQRRVDGCIMWRAYEHEKV